MTKTSLSWTWTLALTMGLGLGLTATSAQAQTSQVDKAQALYVTALAATCAGCHGTQGEAVKGSSIPSLFGRPKDDLIQQLHDFQSGARPSTVMGQLAKGLSDAQIEQIATYFAAQR